MSKLFSNLLRFVAFARFTELAVAQQKNSRKVAFIDKITKKYLYI